MAGSDQGEELAVILKAVQSMTDTQGTILSQLTELNNSMSSVNVQLTDVAAKVKKHDEDLRGNGRIGLIPMVTQMHDLVMDHQEALRGTDERTGLVGRMKQMEERIDIMSKPLLQVGMIVITAVVTAVIALVVK